MRWSAWALCLLSGLCLPPASAIARAPILPGLSWVRLEGAEACISTIALAQRIEDKLGRAVFVPTSAAELTIEGFVAPRAEGGFVSRLSVVAMDGRVLGTRELSTGGVECSELDEALVLVIAVTLYPDTGIPGVSMLSPEAQAALDQWLGGAVEEPEPTPPPVAPPRRPARRARPADWERPPTAEVVTHRDERAWLDLAALGGAGMLPSPAFGAEAGVRLRLGWLPVGFVAQGFLPSSVPSPLAENGEVSLTVARAGMLACPAQRSGTIAVEGCVGIDAGVFYARGDGFRFNSDTFNPLVDLLLQVNLRLWVGEATALRLGLAAGVPLTPSSVEVRLTGRQRVEVFAMSPITVALQLGLTFGL